MFRKTLVVRALAVAFGSAALTIAVGPVAYAQSNATGTIYGNVAALGGTSILIESVGTGAKRTVTPDVTGRFQATALQPGTYKVQLLKGDAVVSSLQIEVLLGQGVEAIFAAAGGTQQLQAVQIVGSRSPIDVSTTNNGSTFTAKQLAALPIAQNVTAIILLAPDSVRADPRYAGGASIGGGAPSENSYYINGFPVTNALTQLGSIELPFGAIQQAQVLTGGFGVEYGRSTGGVVNITTKSGTNTWEGGASISVEPSVLRAKYKNISYPNTGQPYNSGTDGTLNTYNQNNSKTETQYGAYIGGPLIKDKLFMFVAADTTNDKTGYVNGSINASTLGSSGWIGETDYNRRWLAKFDWVITDNHRIEFTSLGDNYFSDTDNYSYPAASYGSNTHGSVINYKAHYENQANITPSVGGTANILKYTGNITPDLTVQALYGESKSPHVETYQPDLSGGFPGILWSSTGRAPGLNYFNAQPLAGTNIQPASAQDSTKSYRLDLEYALGQHTIRAGLDENKLKSANAGENIAGGSTWSYAFTSNPLKPINLGPYSITVGNGSSPLGDQGYYVRQRIFSDETAAGSDQSAQYIEDRYQVTKNILLTLGLRNEGFKGTNGEGRTYLESKNFLSPRIGGAWDVNGDSSLKISGNLGRYSIQTPTHVAVRGASTSTLTNQYFTYTGIDPVTGAPTGLTSLGPVYSPDGETGQAKDPNTISATNLKPSYQDELILGFEKAFDSKYTYGAKLTYRRLGATIDDFCDERPFDKFADDNNIDRSNYTFNCVLTNPGATNKYLVDYTGTGGPLTPVTLTAADMGFQKAQRTFLALDFSLEHAFADGWYGKVTYTWSENKGNTEGQTKSDIGQTDVSVTETWDFPQLMEGAYGFLPNDRKHQLKAYGYYQATPEWGFGGNFLAASGRPKNCFGNYNGTDDPLNTGSAYGSAYFYCSGVFTPRGSQGRLPWDLSLDLNAVYQPSFAKGVSLRVDVFNVFNRQSAQAINEVHEVDGDSSTILSTYGQVISYSAPKAVKLTAQYAF